MKVNSEHSFICRAPRTHDLRDWLFTESYYPRNLRMKSHAHENAYIGLVLRGSYSEQSRDMSFICEQGAFVMHGAGNIHSVQFHDSPTRIFRVELKPPALAKVRLYSSAFNDPKLFIASEIGWMMTRLYKEFLDPDDVTPLSLEGLILQTLADATRIATKSSDAFPRWLSRAREYAHANYIRGFCLDDIAAVAGVHPAYLAREFRKHYHVSVGEYVRRLRVEAACRLLANIDTSLSQIAAATGFADQSHMGKHFKRLTGLTPAQYRTSIRG